MVGWFGDDPLRFDKYSKWWIPYLDYIVTDDFEGATKWRALGANAEHIIPSTGSSTPCDWPNMKEDYNVSFIGRKKAEREQYLMALLATLPAIHIFGESWGGYFVPYKEMIDIIRRSKINLNFSEAGSTNKMAVKARLFEVCLAGGFLLTEYVPGIEEYYEIDKEIVCFKDTRELIDKVAYYLKHDDERRAIAKAGWERATAEYSSVELLSGLFSRIEEDIAIHGRRKIYYGDICSTYSEEVAYMPEWVEKRFSAFYKNWQKAFLLDNRKKLSYDAFAYAIYYNASNIWAWCYYLASFLPHRAFLVSHKLGSWCYRLRNTKLLEFSFKGEV